MNVYHFHNTIRLKIISGIIKSWGPYVILILFYWGQGTYSMIAIILFRFRDVSWIGMILAKVLGILERNVYSAIAGSNIL